MNAKDKKNIFVGQIEDSACFNKSAVTKDIRAPLKALPQSIIDYLNEHLESYFIISSTEDDIGSIVRIKKDPTQFVKDIIGVTNHTIQEIYQQIGFDVVLEDETKQ